MAWGYTPLNLQGQPGISPNWSAPLIDVLDQNQKQKKAADVLLARKQALAQATGPDGKFNSQNAAQYLLGAGDLEGGKVYGQLAENEADREFRRQEAERAQKNADRSYGLQASAASRNDYDVQSIKQADGSEVLVRVNKRDGTAAPFEGIPGNAGGQPRPPKTTEAQNRNSQLYSVIAPEIANPDFDKNFEELATFWNSATRDARAEPAMTAGAKQAMGALDTIISSYLYSVSGATANPGEVATQKAIMTPKWSDPPKVRADKLARIKHMADAVKTAAGPAYQAPAEAPPAQQTTAPEATKSLGGKNYIKINGQWFEQ
jgi:hypothetical protein